MRKLSKASVVAAIIVAACPAEAEVYECAVEAKLDSDTTYNSDQLDQWKFSVTVKDFGGAAELSRCSFSSIAGKITCDTYQVDRIERDDFVGHAKYYHFHGQFDVQIFADLTFLENNGRGSVAFGSCQVAGE